MGFPLLKQNKKSIEEKNVNHTHQENGSLSQAPDEIGLHCPHRCPTNGQQNEACSITGIA
jgi:hypothetical protein